MSTTAAGDLAHVLAAIIARHGSAVLEQRNRLLGLLRDHAPQDLRGVRVLMQAFDGGILERFRALGRRPTEAEVAQEAAALTDLYGTGPDFARAAAQQPLPVQPLPLPAAGGVKAAPAPLPSVQPLPAPGKTTPAWQRWAAIVTAVLLIITGLLRLFGG